MRSFPFRPQLLLLGYVVLLTLIPGTPAAGNTAVDSAALATRARAVLERAVETETEWVWIHALEAWVELGEHERVRTILHAKLPGLERSAIRIGVWRVLATVASTPDEKTRWVDRITGVFLDVSAPDRIQAIESLAKLKVAPVGPTLDEARRLRGTLAEYEALFPLWAMILAGDRGALTQLVGSLQSPEVGVRRRAAFVLRWLRPNEPWVRRALTRACADESSGTVAHAYLLSTAIALELEPARSREWALTLEQSLAGAPGNICLEACQALRSIYRPPDLVRLIPLLDRPEGDARIGAALTILDVLRRAAP